MACLDRKVYDTLGKETGIERAKGCFDDINRKTKNFKELSERLSPLLEKHKQSNADPRRLMKEIIGEQTLAADSAMLARFSVVKEGTPVTTDMLDRAQDTICAAAASHLADSLTSRYRLLNDSNEEFSEADEIKTVTDMIGVLHEVSKTLEESPRADQ